MAFCFKTGTNKLACLCKVCEHWRWSQGAGKAIQAADAAFAQGAIKAGHAGAGTIANFFGREGAYAAGCGVNGAARGAAAGASFAVGGATLVGGIAGNMAGCGLAAAVGGGRGTQHYAGETGEFGGSVAAGAVAGACVAGPPGAAAGAAVGAAGYGITKVVGSAVGVLVKDDRYEWGPGMRLCGKCGATCQNRGCWGCQKKLCTECWQEGHQRCRSNKVSVLEVVESGAFQQCKGNGSKWWLEVDKPSYIQNDIDGWKDIGTERYVVLKHAFDSTNVFIEATPRSQCSDIGSSIWRMTSYNPLHHAVGAVVLNAFASSTLIETIKVSGIDVKVFAA